MIKHNISTVQVFMTEEYNNFSMIIGNRGINEAKVRRIIKEIEGGNDMLRYYPIQVRVKSNKMEILDGQHRFFICKKLKRPVHYIVVSEEKDMTDIARVNSNVEKWKAQDFINCYIQKKNEHYVKLQLFLNTYKFNVGTSISLLMFGTPFGYTNTGMKEIFENGRFKVEKWDEAIRVAETCKKFSAFEFWTDRAFIIAIHKIVTAKKIDIDALAEMCNKNIDMLEKQFTDKQYVFNLEQIANKNKQKRIVLT